MRNNSYGRCFQFSITYKNDMKFRTMTYQQILMKFRSTNFIKKFDLTNIFLQKTIVIKLTEKKHFYLDRKKCLAIFF